MATIEPRLIHLLNDPTPKPTHIDLPPPHVLPLHISSDRVRAFPSRDDIVAGIDSSPVGLYDTLHRRRDDGRSRGDYVGAIGLQPLRRQGEMDIAEPSHSLLSKILDDTPETSDDASNKKRHRIQHGKEEFLQLPQPVKKQKAAPHAPDLPPIINGLHEPPPHAALFPPISSTSFDDEHDVTQLRLLQDLTHLHEEKHISSPPQTVSDKNSGKGSRKRATKPRRKWSEEETNHLLLGVSRHGVGKWTTILDDADFKFNDRTAGDLKDRFRTCCPTELRGSSDGTRKAPQPKARKGIHSENILHEDEESLPGGLITPPTEGSDAALKQKKSRAHRKKMEDLENLGIHAPFKKSHRRERRAFTQADDEEILQGLERYGPAWTKIQRDSRFHLSSRQPTDLRDRIRNKYPSIFQNIEKGVYSNPKEANRNGDIMEPSVTTTIGSSLATHKPAAMESRISRTNSGDEISRWPLHSLDKNHGSSPPQTALDYHPGNSGGGEMDISRLLLDDSRHC